MKYFCTNKRSPSSAKTGDTLSFNVLKPAVKINDVLELATSIRLPRLSSKVIFFGNGVPYSPGVTIFAAIVSPVDCLVEV